MAGAPATLSGWGDWSGLDLVAPLITHTFSFYESGGWLMMPEISEKTETG